VKFSPKDRLPERGRPTHLPAWERPNRPIVQFVTVCTQDRAPLLANDEAHVLLRQLWSEHTLYQVGRYMVMPDHLHFFCIPGSWPPEPLSRWVQFWKSAAARAWPERGIKVWQRGFWDVQILTAQSYSQKWDYVRQNPVRAGLVDTPDEWAYQGEVHPFTWRQ
jgi:putative transposase